MRRDLVKFFICAALFLLALNLLSRMLPPPAPPKKPSEDSSSEAVGEAKASKETAVGGFLMHLAQQRERPEGPPTSLTAVGGFLTKLAEEQKVRDEAVQRARDRRRRSVALGSIDPTNPNFHLYAVFDPRGASVRRLVLNKFKTSNRLGRPVD